jgi:hypothetical protein
MKRHHLIAATVIIVIGLIGVAMYFYSAQESKREVGWCQTKGLEVYAIDSNQICRDHDTGLLYAPPSP